MAKKTVELKNILFIDFFESLKTNDHNSLGITEDEYTDLFNEYKNSSGYKESATHKQLQKLVIERTILRNCVLFLEVDGYDKNLIELIKDYGWELYPDNVNEIIGDFKKRVESLEIKVKVLRSQLPEVDEEKETSAHDVIAQLSLGLEMKLDPKLFTVLEYISYSKALKDKNAQLKQSQNGSNKR